MGVLANILAAKRAQISRCRGRRLPPPPALRQFDLRRPPGTPLRLIAEIKRRSPSAGPLSTRLSVGERAAAYARAGAAAVSVLCDPEFFDGAFEHLSEARAACSLPLLCKDFVLDEWQLDAARAHGASAALLIVRCLSPDRLAALIAACRARDLQPFVEVATDQETRQALDAGADLIGVNARDLDSLELDAQRAARVLDSLPESCVSVHLSGLGSAKAVARVARTSAHAVLIGESLMRCDDPEPLLREMALAAG